VWPSSAFAWDEQNNARLADNPDEIWTRYIPNAERYCYTNLLGGDKKLYKLQTYLFTYSMVQDII
jgi:hypothetical protein